MTVHRIQRLVAAVLLLAITGTVAPFVARADAGDYTFEETYISSAGGTQLHAYVYRPSSVPADVRVPVILTVTPYASSGGAPVNFEVTPTGPADRGPGAVGDAVLRAGYAWIAVSLRGYGGSGGCFDFGGAGEQADVVAAVEWSAAQSWSTGRVGMFGHSYPGWTGVMALATKPVGLAAVVASAPAIGYETLYTNGVRDFGSGTAFGPFYAVSDLAPPSLASPTEQHITSLSGTAAAPACYATVTAGTYDADPASAYWAERNLLPRVRGTEIPTLLTQGWDDFNVRPNAVTPLWQALAGHKEILLGPWDHYIPGRYDVAFLAELVAFYDRFVGRREGAPDRPRVRIQEADGRWRAEQAWPPRDAALWPLPLAEGTYVDAAGNNGQTQPPPAFNTIPWPVPVARSQAPLPTGQGTWTFTQPLPEELHASGVPEISVDVDTVAPGVNVVALVYDVDPDGNARLVSRGAALARTAGTVTFPLYPFDHRFAAGHRIGTLLSGADDFWFEPGKTATPVHVVGGTVSLPFVGHPREEFLAGGPFRPTSPPPPVAVAAETISDRERPATLPSRGRG